ncbi:MAG TPA: carbohydrate ABC transporter permease [Phototrophicaceae bacterium]|nr:carbohydrate ABC transporter permease [Phototrophicaceae bacterium]
MATVNELSRADDKRTLWRSFSVGKLHQRSPLATVLTYVLMIALAGVFLYPLIWMASSSVRSLEEIAKAGLNLVPQVWRFDNYTTVFNSFPFFVYLKNSVITTVIPIFATTISSSLVAFAFARMRVPGRNFLFVCVLATMFLPGEVTIIPNFILFRNLGMINTLYPLIIPAFFGSPFFIFLLRQFYAALPKSLEEAAIIEGASMFQIWWKIFLPLSKPALVAVGVLIFMGRWNDFFGPLIYVNSDKWKTLAVGLAGFQNEHSVQTNLLMAATILMILPCILLFFFAQRAFVEGVTFTGSKEG